MITILYNLLFFALLGFTIFFAWKGLFGDQGLKGGLEGKVKMTEPYKLIIGIGFGAALLVWFIRDFLKGPDSSLWISKIGQWITEIITGRISPWAPENAAGVILILDNLLFIIIVVFLLFLAYYGFLGDHGLRGALAGKVTMSSPIQMILFVGLGAAVLLWLITDMQQGPTDSTWISKVGAWIDEIVSTKLNPWQP